MYLFTYDLWMHLYIYVLPETLFQKELKLLVITEKAKINPLVRKAIRGDLPKHTINRTIGIYNRNCSCVYVNHSPVAKIDISATKDKSNSVMHLFWFKTFKS